MTTKVCSEEAAGIFCRRCRDQREEIIRLMNRVVIEARKACIEAGIYGAIGGEEMIPLQKAIDAVDSVIGEAV